MPGPPGDPGDPIVDKFPIKGERGPQGDPGDPGTDCEASLLLPPPIDTQGPAGDRV